MIGQLGLGTEREQVPWVVLEGLDGFHSPLWVDGVKPHKSLLSQDLWLRRFAFVSPVDGHSAGHQALEDFLCHIPGIAAVFNGQIEPAIFEETLFSVPVARLKQIGVLLPFPSGEHFTQRRQGGFGLGPHACPTHEMAVMAGDNARKVRPIRIV